MSHRGLVALALLVGALAASRVAVHAWRDPEGTGVAPEPVPRAASRGHASARVPARPSPELPGAPRTFGSASRPASSTASAAYGTDAFDEVVSALLAREGVKEVTKSDEIVALFDSGQVSPERVRRALYERVDAQGLLFNAMCTCRALHVTQRRTGPAPFPEYVDDGIAVAATTQRDSIRAIVLMNITMPDVTYQEGARILDAAESHLFTSKHQLVTRASIHALRRLGERRDEFDTRVIFTLASHALRDDSASTFPDALRALHALSPADFEAVVARAPPERTRLRGRLIEELRSTPPRVR